MFTLKAPFSPNDDQQKAIDSLTQGLYKCEKYQTLLGVTGSGKTFTMANVIAKSNLPTLILCHNKTLAGQLYQEFRDFFPDNAVSYFVSYYDYYQPEAYIASSDTYIEKESQINELIDKLRLQTMSNLMTRSDCIVIASVSCIYGLGSPIEFATFVADFEVGQKITPKQTYLRLAELQYERSEFEFKRGTFRVRGENIDIYPSYDDIGYRLIGENGILKSIDSFDAISGQIISSGLKELHIYPTKQYLVRPEIFKSAQALIHDDLTKEVQMLKNQGKSFEAERLSKRVTYDLEMMNEMGYVSGIENYSRYFDGRAVGAPPHTLFSYFAHRFGKNWCLMVDESHMSLPQVRGMYNGDRARKQILIDYGFRLSSAFDNRPLKFDEFESIIPKALLVSATPSEWEIQHSNGQIVEQLVRPTGIPDPIVTIRPTEGAIADVMEEIKIRALKKERTLVTTLTKRTAEDLTKYLEERGILACYLHSDVETLERSAILNRLRKGEYDVLIGINLLREGLDLPEVSLVAILDADKEGFLRGRTSLIQTMGRAARHLTGEVILYADKTTDSMKTAMEEVARRRVYQLDYNQKHNITPTQIHKLIRESIAVEQGQTDIDALNNPKKSVNFEKFLKLNRHEITDNDRKKIVKRLEKEMKAAAENMDFENAIKLRDKIKELK